MSGVSSTRSCPPQRARRNSSKYHSDEEDQRRSRSRSRSRSYSCHRAREKPTYSRSYSASRRERAQGGGELGGGGGGQYASSQDLAGEHKQGKRRRSRSRSRSHSHSRSPSRRERLAKRSRRSRGRSRSPKPRGWPWGGGVHGSKEIYANEKVYDDLLKWRLDYQSHRRGSPRGAKGDVLQIARTLTTSDVRMLPVAGLAAHRRALKLKAVQEAEATSTVDEVAAPSTPTTPPMRPMHVHVGAGRLGLGLMLPALERGARANNATLVLLQRPSDAWAALVHGSVAKFTANEQHTCSLRVVRPATADELKKWHADIMDESVVDGYLVLSEEEAILDHLASTVTSLSCSLGPALGSGLAPLFAAFGRVGLSGDAGRLRLFAGENDHAAVAKLTVPEGLPIQVIPLLVDRVCISRSITEGSVHTTNEPWTGEIVVMTPPVDAEGKAKDATCGTATPATAAEVARAARRRLLAMPPFSGEGVHWPTSQAEAHFLHRRKILTVNGTHTTLAFHTLAVHEPPPHSGLPEGDYELLRAIVGDDDAAADDDAAMDAALQVEETYRMAWSWAVARQLLLLFETDALVARAALGCDRATEAEGERALVDALLEGARVALGRLGCGGDTTKRILGGGVVHRFQTRLKPIASFLDDSNESGARRWLHGSLPRQLLRRAKLTETTMRLAVLGLTVDAERFTAES